MTLNNKIHIPKIWERQDFLEKQIKSIWILDYKIFPKNTVHKEHNSMKSLPDTKLCTILLD